MKQKPKNTKKLKQKCGRKGCNFRLIRGKVIKIGKIRVCSTRCFEIEKQTIKLSAFELQKYGRVLTQEDRKQMFLERLGFDLKNRKDLL